MVVDHADFWTRATITEIRRARKLVSGLCQLGMSREQATDTVLSAFMNRREARNCSTIYNVPTTVDGRNR